MTQTISDEAIAAKSGKTWQEWLTFFESINGTKLDHAALARAAYEQGNAPGWWAQMVTVRYEQHIGRRVVGQDCTGQYQVSVSKTIDGSMDDALARWVELVGDRTEFSDVTTSRGPTTSESKKWRYWHAGLADGSRLSAAIYEKAPNKASFGLGHEKLESSEQVEHWRAYWKTLLAEL